MQYNVVPMTKVETFTYYHLDIYRYFIGRKEQSMNMDNFVRNQEHHKNDKMADRILYTYFFKVVVK